MRRMMNNRARAEQGFGLIELVIALTLLSVGILALFGAFNAGALTLRRAGHVSTAAALADKQMEGFRSLTFASIGLVGPIPATGTVYAGDQAYTDAVAVGGQVVVASCAGASGQCTPSQTVAGPDGHGYEIDTYVALDGSLKKITIVVRDTASLTARPLARETSSFSSGF
jgi:prepilin-type N-terminal cleavage/methylation domain-containing protein